MAENYARLAPVKFGFAWGLIWALGIILIGWMAWLWGFGMLYVRVIGSCYPGYGPTFLGAIWGAIWAFIDFFIFGWLVALVYNCCCRKCPKTSGESSV